LLTRVIALIRDGEGGADPQAVRLPAARVFISSPDPWPAGQGAL